MARRVETLLIDDLDGSTAVETVQFAFQGTEYTIDLSKVNATKMRKALTPWATAARRIPKTTAVRRVPVQRGPARMDPQQRKGIRDWLRARGVEVPERGRIAERHVAWFQAGEVPAGEIKQPDPPAIERELDQKRYVQDVAYQEPTPPDDADVKAGKEPRKAGTVGAEMGIKASRRRAAKVGK